MATLLELHDVGIAFPGRGQRLGVVAEGLDLVLRSGRMHCVTGHGGSGKTSVLRVAAGLLRPTSGRVTWGSEAIDGLGDDARGARRAAQIGYADQRAELFAHLTVLENVLMPAVPAGAARGATERAHTLLDELEVSELAAARPAELSPGERKRVVLARAQLLQPPLLVLDEPTAGLNRQGAELVAAVLLRLRDRGTAILLASQDQPLIDAADNRTVLG